MRLPSYQDLSKEQDKIHNLPLDGSYLVVGPPGTGKTVMALYRAGMLERKGTELRVLMLSRLLKQYTEDASEELEIAGKVETFHRWIFGFWYEHYNRKYPQVAKFTPDWTEILTIVSKRPPPKGSLQHLIVDEGQDFAGGFYQVANFIAKRLTVFADDNQRITDQNSTVKTIREYADLTSTYKLTRNYRNTKEIAMLAKSFYTGLPSGVAELPERSGDLPILIRHLTLEKTAEFIGRYEKSHSDQDIGVLVPDIKTRSAFASALKGKTKRKPEVFVGGKGADAEQLSFGKPGIKLLCYASAKGLEFDTVFLPELQNYKTDPSLPEFKMMLYVVISRARDSLFITYSGEGEPGAVAALPKEYLEIR